LPCEAEQKEKKKSPQPPKAVKMICPPLAEQRSPKFILKKQNKVP